MKLAITPFGPWVNLVQKNSYPISSRSFETPRSTGPQHGSELSAALPSADATHPHNVYAWYPVSLTCTRIPATVRHEPGPCRHWHTAHPPHTPGPSMIGRNGGHDSESQIPITNHQIAHKSQ